MLATFFLLGIKLGEILILNKSYSSKAYNLRNETRNLNKRKILSAFWNYDGFIINLRRMTIDKSQTRVSKPWNREE